MHAANPQAPRVETLSAAQRRRKLWELSPAYHCALIGTCLPMELLRRLARGAGVGQAAARSDYELHHAAVHLAGARNEFSRRAHKALDERFATALSRFAQAASEPDLAELWKQSIEGGGVAAALWALMTHPLASTALLQSASQEVHMLSHQVGAASRADLRRLAQLQDENDRLRARLQEQQHNAARQLAGKAEHISRLERRLADAEGTRLRLVEAQHRLARLQPAPPAAVRSDAGIARRLAESEARRARLEADLARTACERDAAEGALRQWVAQRPGEEREEHRIRAADLSGQRVLYVGGRASLVEQYRRLVERCGGELLHHDGGLEESLKRLPPLLAAADMVVCAAGETSHAAYYVAKRSCKQAGKPCALLRRASLASLLTALRALAGEAASLSQGDTLLLSAA